MANLTLTIDDDLLRRARIRALERGTSVNATVRAYLEDWSKDSVLETTLEEILAVAAAHPASSGPTGRTWTRAELYEREPSATAAPTGES